MLVTCFGAISSGKSALLQKLVFVEQNDDCQKVLNVPKTITTVGVNQYNVPLEKQDFPEVKCQALKSFCFGTADEVHKRRFLQVRELGGSIQPLWPSYIKNSLCEQVVTYKIA